MKKTVLISAPKYYGIDTDIQEAFQLSGFTAVLTNHVPFKMLERVVHQMGDKLSILKPVYNPIIKSFLKKENSDFLSSVAKEKPDLILVVKGDNIFPETLRNIKRISSCPVVSYVWDEPFYVHNKKRDDYRISNFKRGVSLYDVVFVFDTHYIDEIAGEGAKKVKYLPLATNPNRYSNSIVSNQDRRDYDYDVCFIGMPFENRAELFDNLSDYKLGVFGDHWDTYFMLKGKKTPSYYKGKATGEAVNKIYLSSKIVLNIHHPQSIEGLNSRTFDIPACGAFEIVDYKKNLDMHFKMDEEIVAFRDMRELRSMIDFYLKNEGLRRKIADNGRKRVMDEHTWVHRVREMTREVNA